MIVAFFKSMLLYTILLTPIYVVTRILYMRGKKLSYKKEGFMLLFFIYCVCIFSQTIIPKVTVQSGQLLPEQSSHIAQQNFMPFTTIIDYIDMLDSGNALIAFYNLAGNILLFIPFGIFMPMLWHKMRNVMGMCIVALTIPVFIEGTQYFIGRSVDIDDVILNAWAIIFGYWIWKICVTIMILLKK